MKSRRRAMRKSKRKRDGDGDGDGDGSHRLSDNLWADVLCLLPDKQLVQCKCVCKSWRRLISDLCIPTRVFDLPLAGLYLPCSRNYSVLSEYIPIEVDCNNIAVAGGEKRSPVPLMVSTFSSKREKELLDTCNGLLLFISAEDCLYYVCNPTTRESVPIPKAHCHFNRFYGALAFDPYESPRYRVVCFAISTSGELVLDIFSSHPRPGRWLRFPVDLDPHICKSIWQRHWHCVYFHGSLYCLSRQSKHLLRFDFTKGAVDASAIDLPFNSSEGCIGLSMGNLCCSNATYGTTSIWFLDPKGKWNPKYSIHMSCLQNLLLSPLERLQSFPCGFHPTDDVIFLRTPKSIISCGIKHGVKEVYQMREGVDLFGSHFQPPFTYFRFLIPLEYLHKIPCNLNQNQLEKRSDKVEVLMMEKHIPMWRCWEKIFLGSSSYRWTES